MEKTTEKVLECLAEERDIELPYAKDLDNMSLVWIQKEMNRLYYVAKQRGVHFFIESDESCMVSKKLVNVLSEIQNQCDNSGDLISLEDLREMSSNYIYTKMIGLIKKGFNDGILMLENIFDLEEEPVVDENELELFLNYGLAYEFYSISDYLEFMNEERENSYRDEYPKPFKTLKQAKEMATVYQLIYDGKVYHLGNDEVVRSVLGNQP